MTSHVKRNQLQGIEEAIHRNTRKAGGAFTNKLYAG